MSRSIAVSVLTAWLVVLCPAGPCEAQTEFELSFEGADTFLIDGAPFIRVPDAFDVTDFDVRREDTPPGRYGLYFPIDQLRLHGESLSDP